jgi:cell division protein ZapA (FtsZ GTPase activity inhibitor)
MDEITIKVEIAGGIYSLKVDASDEESIKEAVNSINSKISEFEKNYGVRDKKDVLAMVMIQLVSQLYKRLNVNEKELSDLRQLFSDVEEMLQQHQSDLNNIDN